MPDLISRRRILRRTVAVTALALVAGSGALPSAAEAAACTEQLVYIGTQGAEPGQGVFAARLDPRSGKLTPLGLAAEAIRPTWLAAHPTRPLLYAVSEVGNDGKSQGSVATFKADPATGLLTRLGAATSGGGGPTHLALDLPSKTMLVANYGTGQVAALPLGAGDVLSEPTSVQADLGSGPSPRQKGPHAHGVVLDPSRRFALVADLGADRVFVYPYDAARHQLGPASATEPLPAGQGPRRLAFHPSGRFVFLLSELVPDLRVYRWDKRRGQLHLVQAQSPADPARTEKASGAELAVSSDGRFVYASVRGQDLLAVYAVNPRTGALTLVQRIAAGGVSPWSFALAPGGRWLLVANQGSDTVAVFARDPASGKLTPTAEAISAPKPTSVAYLASGCR